MPTPSLPLLHQLLRVLHIPVFPPTLGSISPSLLLIVLETLIGHPLPLSREMRLCETPDAELSVVKCLLGVLADDLLGMEAMTLVDPRAVVDGSERELEVVIMAFAVVAKRRGLRLNLRSSRQDDLLWEQQQEEGELQDPIEPDVSFSSPTLPADDVFTVPVPVPVSKPADPIPQAQKTKDIERWTRESASGSSSSDPHDTDTGTTRRTRTVLDEILEEFGT